MAITYKLCTGATVTALEEAVQECLDLNYVEVNGISISTVIDSTDVITNLFAQAVKLKG